MHVRRLALVRDCIVTLTLASGLAHASDSRHACFGENHGVRSCLFRDVVLSNGTVFYQSARHIVQARSGTFTSSSDFNAFSSPFRHEHYFDGPFLQWPATDKHPTIGGPFQVPVVVEPVLPAHIRSVDNVAILWHFNPASSASFGHCLLNDIYPLIALFGHHDLEFANVTIVLHGDAQPPHVCMHYLRPFVFRVLHGFDRLQPTHYKRIIVGEGGYWNAAYHSVHDTQVYPDAPLVFTPSGWLAVRKAFWNAYKLRPPAQLSSKAVTVVINDKKDRRRIANVHSVRECVQQHIGAAGKVIVHDFASDKSVKHQLEIMQQASIFVSTQGSSSFRHVFMATGSVCILVGSPLDAKLEAFEDANVNFTPFHEIRFFPLTHVQFLKYMVPPRHNMTELDRWALYNLDQELACDRLTELITEAVARIGGG